MLFLGAHQCRQHPSTSQKNGTPGWFLQLLESPLQTLVLLELQWGSKWLLSHPTERATWNIRFIANKTLQESLGFTQRQNRPRTVA